MSPDAIGHYKIIDRIGAGALGEVYRARDNRLGRTVAIKVLPPELTSDTDRLERFLHAARAAATLSHPNIAALFEIGVDGSRRYLVFEFVPGETLRAVMHGRPLNVKRALDFGIQLADALAEAHVNDIIHGDIRPENIIITPKEHAKLLDLGLSGFTAGGAARRAAALQAASGKSLAPTIAPYLSPEELLESDSADTRSDIFSLGVVLFEMLTGRPPFRAPAPPSASPETVHPAAAPSQVNPAVPRDLDPIVIKAAAKKLDARYQSAATLAAELRSAAAVLDIRAAASEAAFEPSPTRARRVGAAVAALLVVTILAGSAWMWRDAARRVWRRWFGPFPAAVVAVLPLEAEEDQPRESRYYTDGLTDDLVTRLGLTPGLKVLGRSSLRLRRGQDPLLLARDTGASVVLSGSVRSQGDDVAITLELLDGTDGSRRWQQTFARPRTQMLAVQAEMADAIARELRLGPVPSAAKERAASRVVDAAAYDVYLRGREAAASQDFARAIDLFGRATDADSGFSEAQAALAQATFREMTASGRLDDAEAWARLRRAAESAATADPDLPDAQIAQAFAAVKLADALAALGRAVQLDPSDGAAYREVGRAIAEFDPERALAFYARSLEVDPGLSASLVDSADASALLDRFPDAERDLSRGRILRADSTAWPAALGRIELARQRADAAAALLQEVVTKEPSPMTWLTYVRALGDARGGGAALAEAARLSQRYPRFCEGRAVLAALQFDAAHRAEAREMAGAIIDEASRSDAPAASARCAALAAAAQQDADTAAQWLRKIAGDEEALRVWALPVDGMSGMTALKRKWYPWSRIAGRAPIVEAVAVLDQAYARLRAEAESALEGLLPSAGK